ncbi:MAG TPA: DUF4097 family beta strand repeat-containing protein [Pyrinomonadaceae bacterium]|nr:DUF4097 family beta strand repeat-containing protein [Pyrinomonadaceae bacterium]
MNKWLRRSAFILTLTIVTALSAFASKDGDKDKGLVCRDDWQSDRLLSHCEIKEQTLPATGSVSVDGRQNGGVSVKGWDRNEILARARIHTSAPTQAEADALAQQITIQTAGAKIFATGPENGRDRNWSVSYEVFVPRRTDLSLTANNGGIGISDVQGRLDFNTSNGGVSLRRVGGTVHGGTTNGGLSIELAGDRWDGEEMDVRTTNGGISMSVPENYSAHLETGTVNGNLSIDFPVTVQGRITRELAVNLGSGGPTIRAMTTNGGVRVRRSGGGN